MGRSGGDKLAGDGDEARMKESDSTRHRIIAVFLLGCLFFTYPLIALFNSGGTIFGVPVLYAYVFGAWAVLIALIAFAVGRRE